MTHPTGREGGFTISELVLVVGVTTLLLVIIVMSVRGIHESTETGGCQSQIRDLRVATSRYLAENGSYPTSKRELIEADLLDAQDAEDYRLAPTGPEAEPRYVPIGDACS